MFLRSLRIAQFRREEFPRDQVELFVASSKKFYQVAPIARMSQYQFSTLEKTKTLSNLLKRSFPQIVHGNSNQKLSIGLCRFQVAQIAPLSQQLDSRDLDFRNFFSPGFAEVEDNTCDGALAIRFIIGRDFAVTRSSPDSC